MKRKRFNQRKFAMNVIIPMQFMVGFLILIGAAEVGSLGDTALLCGVGLLLMSGMLIF